MNSQNIKIKKFVISPEVKMVIFEVLLFAAGFLLTPIKFIFGTYPFGLALVASCGKYTPFAFAGSLLSVVFIMNGNPVYLIALIALMGLRIAGSLWLGSEKPSKLVLGEEKQSTVITSLFRENISVRVALCSLTALGIGVYNVVLNGYVYYDIFVLVFFTVLSGMVTFCFCGALEKSVSSKRFMYAVASFSFCLVYALGGKELQGIDVTIILSYSLILYLSKYLSGMQAAAIGIVLGLAQDLRFAPVFAIAAIVSGFIWPTSQYLAIICAFVLSIGYGVFTAGYEAIVYLVPELLASSLFMYPLLRFEVIPRPSFLKKEYSQSKDLGTVVAERKIDAVKDRISSLTVSFKDISEILKDASGKMKSPNRDSLSDMCLEVCEAFCCSCPKQKICWERDIATTDDNIYKMGQALFENQEVLHTDVDEKFLHRCPNIDRIVEKINSKNEYRNIDGLKNDKLDVSSQDYELISQILSCIYVSVDEENRKDEIISEKISRVAQKSDFICDKIEVYGVRKKRIIATGVDVEHTKCSSEELTDAFKKALNVPLSLPSFEQESGFVTMTMTGIKKYGVKSSWASSVTEKEEINGDTICAFDGSDDKYYMIVCDGMGSGKEAQMTSSVCADFLEKILASTCEKDIALAMLNNFIRAKNIECSSTVDLMEIDLITGEGCFVKSGAAPSFIKRGDSVFKLHSKTAPLGIMKFLDAEQLAFSVKQGDVCVMVSDGIVSSTDECEWLVDILKQCEDDEIDSLPDRIVKQAKIANRRSDDMTVGVIRII